MPDPSSQSPALMPTPAAEQSRGKAMRILFLAPQPFFQNRGTPIAERELLRVLGARGYQIDVLTYSEGEDVDIPNCTIHRIPALPGLRNIRPGFSAKKLASDAVMLARCIAMVRKQRYDLVHAVEEAVFMAIIIKKLSGIPYVYDMDSSLAQQMTEQYPRLRPLERALHQPERLAIRGSAGVLAVCKSLEAIAQGCDPGKLIARVEDVSLLDPEITEGEQLCETIGVPGPFVLYVGNLEVYQGIDLLIESFGRVLNGVPEAHLVIIGGTDEHIGLYTRRCARLGIGEHVHFLGPRPLSQLGCYLRQGDILVSPRIKGLNTPMKIYSYLDAGRPVIATRLPTHTQVLDDRIAFLVEPDADSFGDGIARLLRDEPLRRELADRARERVRQEFTADAFRRKVDRFYDAVERKAGASPRVHA